MKKRLIDFIARHGIEEVIFTALCVLLVVAFIAFNAYVLHMTRGAYNLFTFVF